ncbi:RNA polymerase sigma factor [Aquibacillus koreensis]|uniref:RNA polymerase sigma factor n=1 Tax=Aquibacillus koreensis TaxID=279446 RepID=A0A9X3WPK5_9BACI|nr:RNA polymerase sigma factor [Aquibacillus koreensis]MCT2535165.1 RNA polymerase sigma factor [Aquibacillus koreensis]MDC3421024.1 RNA polymerase sigma factor [Aquibacillus koreensis]
MFDFSEMYRVHYKRLQHVAYAITRDWYLAEDVVQESFIKALNNLSAIHDTNKIGAWLSVITTRTALDFVRREKKKRGIPMDEDMLVILAKEMKQSVEEEVELGWIFEEILQAIHMLKNDYQAVMILKIGKGLKEQEIADLLDLKACTVKTRIYRARHKLQDILQDHQVSA